MPSDTPAPAPAPIPPVGARVEFTRRRDGTVHIGTGAVRSITHGLKGKFVVIETDNEPVRLLSIRPANVRQV